MARRALCPKNVQHPTVATHSAFAILPGAPVMKKFSSILLAGCILFFTTPFLRAQSSEDPSEVFLKAYMTAQQGEKLEHENQFKAALAKYRFAGSLIEELHKSHPDWQPAIVEYRGRKVSDAILRVQSKVSTQDELSAPPPPPVAQTTPEVPQNAAPTAQPTVEVATSSAPETVAESTPVPPPPRTAPSSTPVADDAAMRAAAKKLQAKVDQLQDELKKSHDQFSAAEKEKNTLNTRLQETSSKLEKAQGDLQKSKTAEQKVRDQLTDAEGSLKKVQSTSGGDAKAQEALRAEIARLKKALASVEEGRSAAEKGRAAAEKERDDANAKATAADKQVASVSKERDDALGQLKSFKDASQRVEALVTENSSLKNKLADAEKTVREISEDKPKREQELADVKGQLEQLRQQLVDSQKQNKDYEVTVAGLRSQLDAASSELQKAKLTGANPEETTKLTKENEMLRAIIVRERQEEARRDQAKKLLLSEFDKLQIKSETLNQQIQLLAQPITKLTTDELALLRQPVVSIADENPGAIKTSFTFAKKMTNPGEPGANQNATSSEQNNPPGPNDAANANPADQVADLTHKAKEDFASGKYRSAEKLYQEILTKSPNNLYSLCNLGVVYFRTGRLKAAELTLKKAVATAPKDEFAHTTLGIVFYRQAKFDNALTELTKALAINPKSATAHNYLGITASQKGWQEAAEKEMLQAIANNPDYADAHFNLAVIYATAQPPAKELAKRHYAKAEELGSEPDPALEKLLH
jgi:Flp pilus assembly protein TadD/predicted  nucleic acid-binding Zn-ribbon protein